MTVTFHPRLEWEDPNFPVDARYSFNYETVNGKPVPIPGSGHLVSTPNGVKTLWPEVTIASIHYTADDNLPDGDPGEFITDIPKYLRAIQQSYVKNRAYSIGYNFAYDWLGGVWELRGWNIRCAANKGNNDLTIAHLCLVDGNDPTTLAADQSIREMIGHQDMLAGRDMFIIGHGQLPGALTACPGAGIGDKINRGIYSPTYQPSPSQGATDMAKIYSISDNGVVADLAVLSVTGTFAEWIATENDLAGLVFTGTVQQDQAPGVLPPKPFVMDRGFLKQLVLVGGPPVYPVGYAGPQTVPGDFRRWVAG